MRKLVLIADDLYVRSFVRTGGLAEIDDDDTYWAAAEGLTSVRELAEHPRWLGTVPIGRERRDAYEAIRPVMIAARRRLSRSMAIKTHNLSKVQRARVLALSMEPLRSRFARRKLDAIGLNRALQELLREQRPELILLPSAGTDTLVFDALRGAREVGATTLTLINGWDNVSSKSFFPRLPDWMGAWGPQSAEHAVRIHGMAPERVVPMGVPTFELHLAWRREGAQRPYEFPYVLFAGCALPFDERDALQRLAAALEAVDPGGRTRIVYRPHPWRHPRRRDDSIGEDDIPRVVIDRQIRDHYLASVGRPVEPSDFLPALDYYPSLLGFAEAVVCPMSTMVVESAIVETPVVLLEYDDGVHAVPPSSVAEFEHFDGIDRVEGFSSVRSPGGFEAALRAALARRESEPSLREQIKRYLYFDERSYARRLADLVQRIGA